MSKAKAPDVTESSWDVAKAGKDTDEGVVRTYQNLNHKRPL